MRECLSSVAAAAAGRRRLLRTRSQVPSAALLAAAAGAVSSPAGTRLPVAPQLPGTAGRRAVVDGAYQRRGPAGRYLASRAL